MILAKITGLDVAFVSAMAALAAAIATPLGAYLVAIAANRQKRWETTYADRKQALTGLMRRLETTRRIVFDLARAYEQNNPALFGDVPEPTSQDLIEEQAAASAFGSAEITRALQAYNKAYETKVYSVLTDADLPTQTPDERAASSKTIRDALESTADEMAALREAVRRDLRG